MADCRNRLELHKQVKSAELEQSVKSAAEFVVAATHTLVHAEVNRWMNLFFSIYQGNGENTKSLSWALTKKLSFGMVSLDKCEKRDKTGKKSKQDE